DAVSSIVPELRRYFTAKEGEVGTRMLGAWETGIKDSLGAIRGFHKIELPKKPLAIPRAKSDGLLLEALRQKGGTLTGTLTSIANMLDIPPSTISASVKRLTDRGFIRRGSKSITLLPREV
ncbi:MAG TPA: winged helix-turn-helix domain-containing protein, partial [Xanthobacteraceae bacterium]|nr:winged helix-turn-helix domain-containing protein [Xanthobacteraceae bacterium]